MSQEPGTPPRKVVLITGASAGIGEASARAAAQRGYALALTARRADRLDELAKECRALGAKVLVIPADLADPRAPEIITRATLNHFGRLDALVNNAGLGLPDLFSESRPDELRRQIEVNLTAPLLLAHAALPSLLESKGVLLNVGSSITAIPNPAMGAYGATKAGLAYWSAALRRELRSCGVRVCLVEPGPVKTEFFQALSHLGTEPGRTHAVLEAPPAWMSADREEVARRIVNLIERPRRRISPLRRTVWPWRVAGALFQVCPWLGDVIVSRVLKLQGAPESASSLAENQVHRDASMSE